jgi:hypothetical protein
MSKVSSSPERNTFQMEGYVERSKKEGKEPDPTYLEMWDSIRNDEANKIKDPEWQKNNLEYDLRSTEWMLNKVRDSKTYAQNLYAAMCNNEFMKLDVIPILKEQTWGCSWRHSGGIIADMRQEGDYIDWYCSGIKNSDDEDDQSVPESVVTEEVEADLNKLGWIVIKEKE